MLDIDLVDLPYLKKLTGAHQKSKMIKWLNKNGYKFEIGIDGWPKVTIGYISKRLGASEDDYQATAKRKRGNAQALRVHMGNV